MCKRLVYLITCVLVLGFAAGVATATPVVYELTVDGGTLGGTLTFDTDFAPTSSDGTVDTYTHPNDAIVAFSFYRDGSVESFDQTDGVYELFLTMATEDDTPLSLKIDIDDDPTGEFIFVEGLGLDFVTGLGQYQPGAVNVTGAALTPVSEGVDLSEDPANGSTVGIDRTDPLGWVLPDPNDVVNGTVTCDVWFAIDDDYPEAGLYPGDPNFTNYATKIVGDPEPEDANSVAIPDPPLLKGHTYYWRIDTYDDSTHEPQPVIGKVFTFNTNNHVPEVDIVGDDFAWLTEGSFTVQLTGVVTDDDEPVDPPTLLWEVVTEPNSVEFPAGTSVISPLAADEEVITVTATLVGTYELRLTAFDGVDTGEDTVTITVYENSCEAVREDAPELLLQSDFNEDCVTNLADFAEFAADWLVSTAL